MELTNFDGWLNEVQQVIDEDSDDIRVEDDLYFWKAVYCEGLTPIRGVEAADLEIFDLYDE